jgi:hypothetical protein
LIIDLGFDAQACTTDDEKVEVLANTEIEKLTRLTKYYRVQNMILGTTGSLKNRSIDNLETQKKSISMKNSQFFDYLLYAKLK